MISRISARVNPMLPAPMNATLIAISFSRYAAWVDTRRSPWCLQSKEMRGSMQPCYAIGRDVVRRSSDFLAIADTGVARALQYIHNHAASRMRAGMPSFMMS